MTTESESTLSNHNLNITKMIVEVAFEFCSIGEIDTLKETFQASVNIESKWSTTETFSKYDPNIHRNPHLYIDNALEVKEEINYEIAEERGFKVITEIRYIKGTFWEKLNFQNFPFDVQELELVLTSKLGSDKISLVTDPHKLSYIAFEAKTKFKDQQKWNLFRFVTTSDTTCYDNEASLKARTKKSQSIADIIRARKYFKPPKLVATCYTARKPGFYIINAFFLIFLITLVSFTVFSIELKEPQFRIQSMFTILLAAISLKWSILKLLPSISYLTLLDLYQVLSIFFICMIVSWHAVQASFFPEHNLDITMMAFFMFLFFLKHVIFVIWVYRINNKNRQLKKEEIMYFAKFKDHFMLIDSV